MPLSVLAFEDELGATLLLSVVSRVVLVAAVPLSVLAFEDELGATLLLSVVSRVVLVAAVPLSSNTLFFKLSSALRFSP